MRRFVSSFGAVLIASSAWAGASIKTNAVPIVDQCDVTTCSFNGEACTTNADCNIGTLSEKSKVSLGADGHLKVQLKDVVDSTAMAATGNYYLFMYIPTTTTVVQILAEIAVDGGNGKADIDLSSFLPSGDAVQLNEAYVVTPASMPANCPSGNAPGDLTGRLSDSDCDGDVIGLVGVSAGGKSSLKAFVPPLVDYCNGGCAYNAGVCANNADCDFGTLSPKSKASVTGAGRFKAQLKGVLDDAAAEGSGDYMLYIQVFQVFSGTNDSLIAKVTVADGKGKIDIDLSSFMTPAGEPTAVLADLYSPPTTPLDCPGTGNTAMELTARAADGDCLTGKLIGRLGVAAE